MYVLDDDDKPREDEEYLVIFTLRDREGEADAIGEENGCHEHGGIRKGKDIEVTVSKLVMHGDILSLSFCGAGYCVRLPRKEAARYAMASAFRIVSQI